MPGCGRIRAGASWAKKLDVQCAVFQPTGARGCELQPWPTWLLLAGICGIRILHRYIPTMATSSKAKKTVRIASGRKRARQDVKLNAANTALRSKFRTAIKSVLKAVKAGDKTQASAAFKSAQSVIDSIADKGIFHKNKAARHKSRLAAKVKALATAA